MTDNSYKIIISISHRSISYEYWQKDGGNRLMPMPMGIWPAPLAFYCNGSEVLIGHGAHRAASNRNSGAFDSYFELLPKGLKYSLGGYEREFNKILTDASDPILGDFYSSVLYNDYGTLDDNKPYMPLTIVCESDVIPDERASLKRQFGIAGYSRVQVQDYQQFIDRYVKDVLARKYDSDKVLVVWTEGYDLTLTLFDTRDAVAPQTEVYEGLGIDPRMEYVENLIWESIINQNPWKDREEERAVIAKAASDFLASKEPIVTDFIVLSDGQKYRYSLNRNSISYLPGDRKAQIKDKLDRFLRDRGAEKGRTLLLLRGVAANNDYFEQTMRSGFSYTIKSDRDLRERVMRQIIDLKDEDSLFEIKQEVSNISETVKEIGKQVDKIESEVQTREPKSQPEPIKTEPTKKEIPDLPPIPKSSFSSNFNSPPPPPGMPVPPPLPPEALKPSVSKQENKQIKELGREWKYISAQANGKVRQKLYKEALEMLNEFGNKCRDINGIDKIHDELAKLTESINAKLSEKEKTGEHEKEDAKILEREWRELRALAKNKKYQSEALLKLQDFHSKIKSVPETEHIRNLVETELQKLSIDTQAGITVQSSSEPLATASKSNDEGQLLISDGKLKEARDWYRGKGEADKARDIQSLIRALPSVNRRVDTIADYRSNRNMDQIKRIIKELEECIALCKRVGYDYAKYQKSLAEYKRIK